MIYDKNYYLDNDQVGDRPGLRFFARVLKKYFRNGIMLDYGCGTGHFLKKFQQPKYKQLAYDISKYALEATRKNNPDVNIIHDISKDIGDNFLDCVSALHVLEHLKNPKEVLKILHAKLKVGGFFYYVVPNTKSLGKNIKKADWFAYRDASHISLNNPKEWQNLTISCGFEIIKIGTDGLWDVPYYKTIPLLIQKLVFYPTIGLQFLTRKLFLPLRYGENLVIVSKKTEISHKS